MTLAVDPSTLRAADRLDLGQYFLVRTGDRENHALTPFDLFGRRDAQLVVGDANLHQELDGQVAEGGIREKDHDSGHFFGVFD